MKKSAALCERDLKQIGYQKPSANDNRWCNPLPADEAYRKQMELGSRALLKAIWFRHQRIMLVAKARGRLVERP